jgi:hypothetical protein
MYILVNQNEYGGCPFGYNKDEIIVWPNLMVVLIVLGVPVGQWWDLPYIELAFHLLSMFILGFVGILVMPIICCIAAYDDNKRKNQAIR